MSKVQMLDALGNTSGTGGDAGCFTVATCIRIFRHWEKYRKFKSPLPI